jgi:hypothetical protein
MKNYNERLKSIFTELGLTEYEAGKSMGMDRPDKLYKIVNGHTKNPGVAISALIKQAYPQVNLNWLDGGVGEMFVAVSRTEVLEEENKQLLKRLRDAEASFKMAQILLRDRLTEEERSAVGFNPRVSSAQCSFPIDRDVIALKFVEKKTA